MTETTIVTTETTATTETKVTTETYTIPTEHLKEVTHKLEIAARKAARYGGHIEVSYGEPYAGTQRYMDVDNLGNAYEVESETIEVVDVTITSDEFRNGNHRILAKIDYEVGGNVVRCVTDEIDESWWDLKPFCEHCNSNHNLKHTFVVENVETGKRLQVGKTCLKDYTGIDPQLIGLSCSLRDIFLNEEGYDNYRGATRVYNTFEMLANAIDLYDRYGYIGTAYPNSNKDRLIAMASVHPSDELMTRAEDLAKTILEMEANRLINDIVNNVATLIKCRYCKPDTFGYVACAPRTVKEILAWRKREAERAAAAKVEQEVSKHIGTVGERMTIDVDQITLLTSYPNQFGTTHVYKLMSGGNVLIWYASSLFATDTKRVKATVKAHNERNGVAQTIVTRCKAC